MSLTSGFFDSVNGDRMYNTLQMSSIFDGIIHDGVYETYGDHFKVTASEGLQVNVGTGRAWFDHTWTLNDSVMTLDVATPDFYATRIDGIFLKVDRTPSVRENSIIVVTGTASTEPEKPVMSNTFYEKYYPIAYITVGPRVTEIVAKDIENVIGQDPTPFVTGVLEHIDVSELVTLWQDEWEAYVAGFEEEATEWWNEQKDAFIEWFEGLQYILDGDVAGHLQNEIDALDSKIDTGLDTKQNNDHWVNYTLLASGWEPVEDTDFYSYSLEGSYPSSQFDITDVMPNSSTTLDMRNAFGHADCSGYDSRNVITCHKTKPVIDINVSLCLRPKTFN